MMFLFVAARLATRSHGQPGIAGFHQLVDTARTMACSRTAPRRLGDGMLLWYSTVRTVLYCGSSCMRAKGMGYDTGFRTSGSDGRPVEPAVVRRELEIIRDDLHCNAVRLIGNDLDPMELVAGDAADLGLEVWFSPYPMELDGAQLLEHLADAAERTERLRGWGAEVVFVAGAELSLFNRGFLPGDSLMERTTGLLNRDTHTMAQLASLPSRMNGFLAQAVRVVRERFGGKVTYAAVPFEGVDWTPFDIVSVDLHRSKEIAHVYQQGVRQLVAQRKPVAITEFGCSTYRGASDYGARGGEIIDYDGWTPVRLKGHYIRAEQEQATYLRELLDVFYAEGVDAAFVCTFIQWHLPHRDDPERDLDLGSAGIVKVLEDGVGHTYPGMPWEPKAAFAAVAECYERGS
jgi:hypothetical protein